MRIFIGISLPDEICESLTGLSIGLPEARWVDGKNMHITLSFIGEADDELVQDIDNALSDIKFSEFELKLTNPGCFESRHMARTLWVGVAGSEPLRRLKSKVDIALARTGIKLERHRFKPHVTIARLKKTPARTIIPYMETHSEFAKGPFTVDNFIRSIILPCFALILAKREPTTRHWRNITRTITLWRNRFRGVDLPKNPANAAFVYVPDNYDIPERGVVGRQSATAGFLSGFLAHSGVDEYWCYAHSTADFDHFRRFIAASAAPSAPLKCMLPLAMSELSRIGTLYRPGPDIGDYAWLRRHFDQRAFSLCGITHTVSDHAAMEAIGRLLIAPVQPWDALVCTSRAAKAVIDEIIGEWAGYLGERFSNQIEARCKFPIIPLGVDCDAYTADPAARESLRIGMGIAEDDVAVLFMGRLNHVDKANPVPMYLALEAAVGNTDHKLHLIHAGQFPGPDMEQGFKDAAAAFAPGVEHHFIDGSDAEIYQNIWKAADIFISLSDNIQETFGLTPIEAMAAGLPLVVSDWNGYRDTVQNGEQGFTIPSLAPPPGLGREIAYFHASDFAGHNVMTAATSQSTAVDITATAKALSSLINNSDLRHKMGHSSRCRARQLYDWRKIVAAYQELWTELAEIRGHTDNVAPVSTGRAADPLKGDPFAMFRGHPSTVIGPSSVLMLSPQGNQQQLSRLLGSAIAVPLPQVLLDADDMTAVVKHLKAGPVTLSKLIEMFSSDRHTQIYLSVGWLAKMGMVTIEGVEPGKEFKSPEFAASGSWKMLSV